MAMEEGATILDYGIAGGVLLLHKNVQALRRWKFKTLCKRKNFIFFVWLNLICTAQFLDSKDAILSILVTLKTLWGSLGIEYFFQNLGKGMDKLGLWCMQEMISR